LGALLLTALDETNLSDTDVEYPVAHPPERLAEAGPLRPFAGFGETPIGGDDAEIHSVTLLGSSGPSGFVWKSSCRA
jgi:hypothetical protein